MGKFYCPTCKEIKSRLNVKKRKFSNHKWYECRQCHNEVISLKKKH